MASSSVYRLSDAEKSAVFSSQLDDEGLLQGRVRHAIHEHDPSPFRRTLPRPGEPDVDHFVLTKSRRIALPEDGERSGSGVGAENAVAAARWIFGSAQRGEKNGAEEDPQRVERDA
jgi:hypothetical protein